MPSESHARHLEDVLARAWAALYGDDPSEALPLLRAAGCLAPDCGDVWATSAELSPPSSQALLWGRAVACDPGQRRLRLAWGEALGRDDPAAAVEIFLQCVEERGDDAAARLGLGRALAGSGRAEEALLHYREARMLTGARPDVLREIASLYIVCGDPLAAAEALAPITGPHDPDAEALVVSARAWVALGEADKARKALIRAQDLGVAEAAAELARLSDPAAAPPPPDAAYVRALFDRYAERFDDELVNRLEYRGPRLIADAAARALPGAGGLRVLDLGCGTGLAGEVLRAVAADLHGVDLSSAMIAKARKRNLYDHLIVGGLEEALRAETAAWDLLAAADVLMYLGDLRATFAAAAAALRPGGALVFSVEEMSEAERAVDPRGPYLRESRRYAHSEAYLRDELATAGLEVGEMSRAALRMDRREPVMGLIVAAKKGG
jgi:predicted TPR repeat methyltransferase